MNQFDAVLITASREREHQEIRTRQQTDARTAEFADLIRPLIEREQAREEKRAGGCERAKHSLSG